MAALAASSFDGALLQAALGRCMTRAEAAAQARYSMAALGRLVASLRAAAVSTGTLDGACTGGGGGLYSTTVLDVPSFDSAMI